MTPEPQIERVTTTRRIYEGRIVNLREDEVALADGRSARREVVEHADVAAMVPIDADGNVILVRQYRLPARESLLEIPAGGADEGESIEDAAQRELREETGYRAGRLERLCGFYVSPGYCTEFIHVFLATDLVEDPTEGDTDEVISLERMSLVDAVSLIEGGRSRTGRALWGCCWRWREPRRGGFRAESLGHSSSEIVSLTGSCSDSVSNPPLWRPEIRAFVAAE